MIEIKNTYAKLFLILLCLGLVNCSEGNFQSSSGTNTRNTLVKDSDADIEKNSGDSDDENGSGADGAVGDDDEGEDGDDDADGATGNGEDNGEDDGELGADARNRNCNKHVAVALVLDRSGSMEEPPGGLVGQILNGDKKIEVVRKSAGEFLDGLVDKDYSGLAGFSTSANQLSPMSQNSNQTKAKLSELRPGGNTNITSGLSQGIQLLNQVDDSLGYQKVLVLLSDGEHNTGSDPVAMATTIKADQPDVKIVTVGYQLTPEGKDTMRDIATDSRFYLDAPNSDAVLKQFRALGRSICEI